MKNNKGFTLVELLAVIVILAVILVIAVPKILDTINKSKLSSMESSAKMVASAVETAYQTSIATGSAMPEDCMGLGNLDTNEYASCTYTLDNGKATVTLKGKTGGKFDGLKVKGGKTNASLVTTLVDVKDSFADYSWADIKILAHAASENEITYAELESTYHLEVGAEKCITLNGFTTTNDNGCGEAGAPHSGFKVRIANMSDGEANTCGTAGFSETACGFVVEFKDIITKYYMNLDWTNVGGWKVSKARAYLNGAIDATTKDIIYSDTVGDNGEGTIYNALPSEVKSIIVDTEVVSGHGKTAGETNFTTTDKIYLLSAHELWSSNTENDTAYANTRQLDIYKNNNVTSNSKSIVAKKGDIWWLRSANSSMKEVFLAVSASGINKIDTYQKSMGISPAFRIA